MPIPEGYQPVRGSERRRARDATRVRPADRNEVLSVTIYLRRRPDAPPLPDLATRARTPLNERKFLTRQQFADRYGASRYDLDQVRVFARNHGLAVKEANAARRAVVVSGTVAQMESAFALSLHHYEAPGETYRSYEGSVHVPAELADIVESVLGFHNRRIARHHLAGSGVVEGSRTRTDAERDPIRPR